MNPTARFRISRRKLVIIGLVAMFGCLAIAVGRKDRSVGLDTPIVFDDFAFTVKEVRTSPGDGPGPDQGRLLTVTIQVANQARRVSYQFKPGNVIISDESGQEYRIDPAEQRKFDATNPSRASGQPPIPAGQSATFDLTFRVPSNLKHPRMRLSSGGPVGDFLESVTAGSASFDLEQ